MHESSHLPAQSRNGHVVELIARSLDEPLSPSERARVKTHLQECITCRLASDGLYEFDALMKRTHMALPDEGFALRVLYRIDAYEKHRSRREWLLTLLILFLGAVVSAGWLVMNLSQLLNGLGALFTDLVSIVPVWLNALLVLMRYLGAGPLLVYALIVLALIYVWTRASGGLVALQWS